MTPSAQPLRDQLIQCLYAAVGNDAAWPGVVQTLTEYFGAQIGMLVVAGKGQRDQSFYAAFNHSESVARAYSDHWWQHDVMLHTVIERKLFVSGAVMRGSDIVPPEQLRQTAYFREFMLTMPAEYVLACVLSDGSDPLLAPPMHLSLFRHPGEPDFSRAQVDDMKSLLPHLHRAFELHWQMRHAQEQIAVFHHSLDELDFGLLFIDGAQRVRYANARARRLGEHAGMAALLKGLPQTVPQTGELADLLQACALGQGGALVLQPGDPASATSAHLLALTLPLATPSRNVAGHTRASVILLLVDPAQQPGAAIDFLMRAFGLSPAQTRLIPLLLENCTPAQMAQRLNVSLPTVRSQLSAIYTKTGTGRQQELIRLLGALPAIRSPQSLPT